MNVSKENETGRRKRWCWKKNERRFRPPLHSLMYMVLEVLSSGEEKEKSSEGASKNPRVGRSKDSFCTSEALRS